MTMTNNYKYGTRAKIVKDILKLESDVRFIPMHRETEHTMESWSDEYIARYRWQLLELKSRQNGR